MTNEVQKNFLIPDVGVDYRGYRVTRNVLLILARFGIIRATERESTINMFVGFIVKIGSPSETRTHFP